MEITNEDIINIIEQEISRVLENDNRFLGDLEGWFDTKGRRNQYIKHFPNECAVYLTIVPKGSEYYIDMIETIGEDCGRKGYASQVMSFITDAADTNRVSLTLDVASWPNGPDAYDLREWYKGYGFEDVDGHPSEPEMRREPRNSLDEKKKKKKAKTDYSKEKKSGLHGWFSRQGGKGKSKGWVDCNTCRKDKKTGRKKCKSCGRKSGEKRAKYPSCRPTPASCGTKGKGKKWGKKK